MVCTYDFSGNCRAIRLCKPEIFEYRGFSPRITANSRDRELSLPQFALFVLFLPRLLRYTPSPFGAHRGASRRGRGEAPRLTSSMRNALEDLQLDQLVVIYPGDRSYPLIEKVTAVPLSSLGTDMPSGIFE